jgi:hypothetical protein
MMPLLAIYKFFFNQRFKLTFQRFIAIFLIDEAILISILIALFMIIF